MVDGPKYVDINIFVYWLGKHPTLGEVAYEWIKKIERSPRGRYVTSSLTLYEALVVIAGLAGKSLKDRTLIEGVVNSITNLKGLVIEPLKLEDFTRALDLMEEYGLDYEDSLHLSVAIKAGAKEIVSNDKDFDKTPLKRTI